MPVQSLPIGLLVYRPLNPFARSWFKFINESVKRSSKKGRNSSEIAKVIYHSKDAKTTKTFDALDWHAQLATHIPNKGEQIVRYGACPPWRSFYSNKSRGLRKKAGTDNKVPALIKSEISSKATRLFSLTHRRNFPIFLHTHKIMLSGSLFHSSKRES